MRMLTTLFVLFFSSSAFADQPYNLVQINCYPSSGYFEIRYFEDWNLNMHTQGLSNEDNLYSLTDLLDNKEKVNNAKCSFDNVNKYVEKHSIIYQIKPLCLIDGNRSCMIADAKISIKYWDGIDNISLIEEGQFCLLEDKRSCGFGPRDGSRITSIKYLAKDNYISINYREQLENNTFKILEKTIFIDKKTKKDLPFNFNYFLD